MASDPAAGTDVNPAAGRAVRLAGATALLYLVLIQPNHPAALSWGALAVFPLELPLIVSLLVALGNGGAGRAFRLGLVTILMLVALLKLADFASFVAFNRGFNALADYHLIHAAWTLGKGTVGTLMAALAAGGILALVALAAVALWWATGIWASLPRPVPLRLAAAVIVLPTAGLAAAEIGQARGAWSLPDPVAEAIPGAAFTARVALERIEQFRETRADLAEFRAAARDDPMRRQGPHFDRLGDRDLILIYVESYGRSSFDNPLYSSTHTKTLARAEAALSQSGMAMRSGWARAPMVGGQSWLTHGSVASGLWIENQGRYRALLASERQTLFHFAQEAGRRTVAVMPAHVFPWPEGAFFGFDAIYNASDLGYEGEPFNWVTMPDQFTLHALDRLERDRPQGAPGRTPRVIQVALVSSHAPWVPIPPVIDWDAIGDGRVFNEWATSGDPPDVVWRDHDRVRAQFRKAIDYSLQTVAEWAERQAGDPPLIIVMGDHEPARFVSGVDGFDVPVHVIGPEDLVARFADAGFGPGLLPDADQPAIRMDRMRDEILRTLGAGVK